MTARVWSALIRSWRNAVRAAGRHRSLAAMWTISFNIVGKLQSLAVVVSGGVAAGLGGIGATLTGVGAALLGVTFADFGFSTEAGRAAATLQTRDLAKSVGKQAVLRSILATSLAPAILVITTRSTFGSDLGRYPAVAAYAGTYLLSTSAIPLLYGALDFRSATVKLGTCRLAAGVFAVAITAATGDGVWILPAYALGETVGGVLLWLSVFRIFGPSPADDRPHVRAPFGWLGVAAVINVFTNQSDVLIVSSVLTTSQVGIFGLASQVQNAVATLAVASAGPLSTFVAKAEHFSPSEVRRLRHHYRSAGVLLAAASLVALVLVLLVCWRSGLLRYAGEDWYIPLAIGICALSALPSVVANVDISVCAGLGAFRQSGIARSLAGVAAIPLIFVLAQVAGLFGACLATVGRDIILVWSIAIVLRNSFSRRYSEAASGPSAIVPT